MWRSIIIYNEERLNVAHNSLIIKDDINERIIPLEDINCIVVDNLKSVITTYTLSQFSLYNIVLIICNSQHLPCYCSTSYHSNYHLYKVFKLQKDLNDEFKNKIWDKIIEQKIKNQTIVLKKCGINDNIINRMIELSNEITNGDGGNREGIAAKMFFRSLYGSEFVRHNDDIINLSLDFGYSIIYSQVSKCLAAYGFNSYIGIHHISETNEFNLASDLMEPLRPLIDEFVDTNIDEITVPLDKTIKSSLINILNKDVCFNKKKTKVRYAIELMVKSLYSCLEHNDINRFILPEIYDK